MNELDLPLRSPALYNPHLLGREELVGLFSARQSLLEELLRDLRSTPEREPAQHHLLVGQRGMGKTMLLLRIQYAVEDDPELRKSWLPLSFPEEQYNVAGLSDFWLNCIDALSDALERRGSPRDVSGLDEAVEALRKVPEPERALRALDILLDAGKRLGKRLLLLVDNADLVLDRIDKQEWTLREALSSEPALAFLGASAAAIESTYDYGKAFYDFFRIHELGGLSLEETRNLLLCYAEAQGRDEIRRIVEEEVGRVRTLHTLTGGNPRTLVLLFNTFVQGPGGNVRTDLEQLLDQSTPLYKARFEALPAQSQQVVDALAIRWDPASAGELAEGLRLPINAVSAQLNRLVKQGIVEKVPYEPANKTGFQIAERFFNIWYLMRASRRVRRRLIWLVEFLRMFYGEEELRQRARTHLRLGPGLRPRDRLHHAEYGFALASALPEGTFRSAVEMNALQTLTGHEDLRRLVDFGGEDEDLKNRAEYLERYASLRKRLDELTSKVPIDPELEIAERLPRAPLPLHEKELVAEELSKTAGYNVKQLATALTRAEEEFLKLVVDEECRRDLLTAIEQGHMMAFDDVEGARVAEASLEVRGLVAVAAANRLELTHDEGALDTLNETVEDATSPYPWLVWLKTRAEPKPETRTKAIEIRPDDSRVWNNLGAFFAKQGRHGEAEGAFKKAIESQPGYPMSWYNLGVLLAEQGRHGEAEDAYRKAIARQPTYCQAWHNLGILLDKQGRHREAEDAFKEAAENNPDYPASWYSLGILLAAQNRYREAEDAYRKAAESDSDDGRAKHGLAWLLFETNRNLDEAEDLAKQADSSSVAGPQTSHALACILLRNGKWTEALEAAQRFLGAWAVEIPEGLWPDIVVFFREAVMAGKAREASELLDGLELGDRWRPLREAIEALARGNRSYLLRVATEVRKPAEDLLRELQASEETR